MAKFTTALFINNVFKTFEQFIFKTVCTRCKSSRYFEHQRGSLSGGRVCLRNSNISFAFSRPGVDYI